jgi:Ca2+-binding EF-hand superfamily protein
MKYIVCFIVGMALVFGGGLAMAADKKAADPFTAMDTDKDGKVSLKEFQAGKKDAGAAEKDFKAMDKNGDGSLSKDELGAAKKAAEPKKK